MRFEQPLKQILGATRDHWDRDTHRTWLPWISVNHLHSMMGLEELDPALYQRLVKGN